jgi:hypothetical protein
VLVSPDPPPIEELAEHAHNRNKPKPRLTLLREVDLARRLAAASLA